MAKNSTSTKNPSRIRFVMVEAELGDGDIGQITSAIQNALRAPPPTLAKRIAAPMTSANGADHQEPEIIDEPAEEIETVDVGPQPVRQRTPRKPGPMPKVINLDIDGDHSLASFAAKVNPTSHHKRYLAVAAWLHLHRKTDIITTDHIYTCYRHLNWPSGIADFAQPFRELKHKQYFTQPEAGKYAINQLGLAQVAKLTNGGANGAA